jgi:hypothetical protein
MAIGITATLQALVSFGGKVARINPRGGATFIRLDIDPKVLSANGLPPQVYFELQLSHPNYNALYSLALAAAANRWPLLIRFQTEGNPLRPKLNTEGHLVVQYMVVDWAGQQDD